MKRLRFLPFLLLILSACSENIIVQEPVGTGNEGAVSIALSTDLRNETTVTKVTEEPNPDDFRVAIYKTPGMIRLYNDSYANTKGRQIKLNAGEYQLIAQHGDSTACGFDKPYYMADPLFKVEGPNTNVEAVAKLANVKLAVKYDASITDNPESYADYYTIIKRKTFSGDPVGKDLQLKFTKDETRCGYIPGGELVLDIRAKIDGVWKAYQTAPVEYKPNDFVTFTISTDASMGNLVINIKLDNSVENKEENIEIPAITVPQEAPVLTLSGFDSAGNSHVFVEGVSAGANAMANFVAKGALAQCYLTIESEYLAGKCVHYQVDFTNLTSTEKASLKAAGFGWDSNMETSRKLSYIDFSSVIANMLNYIKAESSDKTIAKFTLKVEDSVAKTTETSFSIVSAAVNQTVSVENYNVWAKRIKAPTVTSGNGNMSLFKLQMSTDQKVWTNVGGTPKQNGNKLSFENIEGTVPGTTYYLRSIYNGNANSVSPVVSVRTEDAAQVGNAGFEDYQLVTTDFGSFDRNWYLPYKSGETDPWWACNSRASMKESTTVGYNTYKNLASSG